MASSRARKRRRQAKIIKTLPNSMKIQPSDTRNTDEIMKEKWDANRSRTPTPRLPREAAMAMWNKWMSEQDRG